jgi:transmembrane sensor
MKMRNSSEQINQDLVDQASRWFVEFRIGDADTGAREQFNAWLRASPLHIRAYLEVAATYAGLAPRGAELKFDFDELIQSARADQNVVSLGGKANRDQGWNPPKTDTRRRLPRFRAFANAAVLLIAVAGILGWLHYNRGVYDTQIGEQRSLLLGDGSQISLNARSKVRVRFGKGERRIDLLHGQALFQVAKDAGRPFVVRIGDTKVRALGTRFDVDRRVSGTTVTVLEGKVAVISAPSPASPPPILSAGERLTVFQDVPQKATRADIVAATAWTQRKLVFNGTPLADVVEEFNRYNTRQLVIADRDLESLRVSGVYASPDPASLINFLRTERGISVAEERDEVRIARE